MQEIESQAISAQREINVVKGAVTTKQRDIRLLDLTTSEVKQLSKDTKIYEGVGKMCELPALLLCTSFSRKCFSQIEGLPSTPSRFVFSPTADVEKRLLSETAELKLDISNLNKKLNYLETTYRNSQGHIDRILHSGGRPWRFLDLKDSYLGDLPWNYESTPLARYYRVSELRPRRIMGYKLKKKVGPWIWILWSVCIQASFLEGVKTTYMTSRRMTWSYEYTLNFYLLPSSHFN